MSSHSDKGEKTEIGKNACIDLDRANIVTLYFLVKDTSTENYTDAINVTMARVADNTGDQEYVFPIGKVRGYETQTYSFEPLEDLDSNVYVKVDLATSVQKPQPNPV